MTPSGHLVILRTHFSQLQKNREDAGKTRREMGQENGKAGGLEKEQSTVECLAHSLPHSSLLPTSSFSQTSPFSKGGRIWFREQVLEMRVKLDGLENLRVQCPSQRPPTKLREPSPYTAAALKE